MQKLALCLLVAGTLSQPVAAAVCDYTPSKVVGAETTTAASATGAAVATAGVGMKAAGFYTLVHSVTGATMLGSTAAGASAAGTVGIIGGTAGVIGTAGAVLMSPFVMIPAAIVAGSIAAYEGGCYLAAKK